MDPPSKQPASEIALSALEALSSPVLVFDAARHVAYTNAAAETALARGMPLRRRNGRLEADGDALTQAIKRAHPRGSSRFELADRTGEAHLFLLHQIASGPEPSPPYYVLVRTAEPMSTGWLMRKYALTRVEAELALLIVDDIELTEVGDRLNISRHTARKYLQAVFQKVGVRRQVALVRKIMRDRYLGSE